MQELVLCQQDQPRHVLPQHVGGAPGQLWHSILHLHLPSDAGLPHQEEQALSHHCQLCPLSWGPHYHLQVKGVTMMMG